MILMQGVLEIDAERGVIYFHANDTGHSALRICRLPKPIPNPMECCFGLDIVHMHGCNWPGKKEVQNESVSSDICSAGSDTCPPVVR